MGGGLESRCVGRVCGADGAGQYPHRTHDLRSGSQIQKFGAENHILQLKI